MSDDPSLDERLALVLRGVQRMADSLGGVEQRLTAVAERVEEHRVRTRTEQSQLSDVVTALAQGVDVLLREQQALAEQVKVRPPAASPSMNAVERLTEAVRGLRDDLAESHRVLQEQTRAAMDRVGGEQAERAMRIHEAIGEAGQRTIASIVNAITQGDDVAALAADLRHLQTTLDGRHVVLTEAVASLRGELGNVVQAVQSLPTDAPAPVVAPADDTAVRAAIAALRDDLGRLQGELLATAGQLQIDVGAGQAELRDRVVAAVERRLAEVQPGTEPATDVVLDRLAALETRLPQPTSLAPVLERLEALEARLAETPAVPAQVLERLAAIEARLVARLRAEPEPQPVEAPAPAVDPALLERLASLDVGGIYDRLGGIEWRLGERLDPIDERLRVMEQRIEGLRQPAPDARLVDRLASLEAGLEQLAQREDVRRGVDRVLGAVSSSEQAVAGEVRAVDARIGAIAEEVRIVRVLRDGLEALADGIDGVRQLAARSATSQQMTEVTRELGAVLAEIETARSQVLRVEQSTSPVAADVVQVGNDVDDLGRRIDQLAEVIEERMTTAPAGEGAAVQQVAQRLRQVSESAKLLGNGVLEDLRVRRGKRR